VVKLTQLSSNLIFDMGIVFMINFLLVKDDVFIDSKVLLVTDFVNLKIKLTQSFEGVSKKKIKVKAQLLVNRLLICCMFMTQIFIFTTHLPNTYSQYYQTLHRMVIAYSSGINQWKMTTPVPNYVHYNFKCHISPLHATTKDYCKLGATLQ
jgi:hypothetical protein